MNNKQFLNQRWKNTDKLLRGFQNELTGLTKDLKVDIMDLFEGVNVALADLHKPISERDKDRLNKSIKQWEKEGLDNDYLNYKLSTRKRKPNYEEYLILMLLGLYAVYMKNTYETSKNTLKAISKDAYSKAVEEMGRQPKNPKRITWGLIEDLLIVNTLNMYLREYLELLVQTNQQEAYKIYLQSKQVSEDAKISEEGLADLLQKQQNRLINIRRDKESGVYVDVSHELWNEMYVEPYKEENVQVRFIAEVDNATTMMCKGMDGMLFYTDDWNRYYRWSELDKRDVLYTTFGLKVGENLPPINNHFHWCRSTITYLIDEETERYLATYIEMNKLIPEYLPETYNEFIDLVKNNPGYIERMEELKRLRKYFNREYVMNGRENNSDKLQHISFKTYAEGYEQLKNSIEGTTTINGIVAKGVSFHFYDRTLERNVDIQNIIDTITLGTIVTYKSGITDFVWDIYKIGVSDNGNLITCIKKGR